MTDDNEKEFSKAAKFGFFIFFLGMAAVDGAIQGWYSMVFSLGFAAYWGGKFFWD